MSAFGENGLNPFGSNANGGSTGGVLDKLDSFVVAAKQLETALNHERESTRKLKQDLEEQRNRYERQRREDESALREAGFKENKFQSALKAYQENERRLVSRAQALTTETQKIKEELTQYRSAWADVLQREREAKLILQESDENRRRTTELEVTLKGLHAESENEKSKRQQAERHANSYQLELKNALVRLHSAEVKFNELNRELQAYRAQKRNLDDEVAKIEQDLRERLSLESLKDREKTKAELEREMALDRERYREQVREQIRVELARSHDLEREQFHRIRDGLETEVCSLRLALDQTREKSETLRVENSNRIRTLQEQAREELNQVRDEMSQKLVNAHEAAKNDHDQIRRDLNSKLLELQVRTGELEAELRSSEAIVTSLRRDEAAVKTLSARLETLELENSSLKQTQKELEDLRTRSNVLLAEKSKYQERCQSLERTLLQVREDVEQNLEKIANEARKQMSELPLRVEIQTVTDQIEQVSVNLRTRADAIKAKERGRILARLDELFKQKTLLEARQAEALMHSKAQKNAAVHASQSRSLLAQAPGPAPSAH